MVSKPTESNPLFQFVREPQEKTLQKVEIAGEILTKAVSGRPIGVVVGCFSPGGTPMIGFSLCNPRDRWDRAKGRRIAMGRLDLVDCIKRRLLTKYPKNEDDPTVPQLGANLNIHKVSAVACMMENRLNQITADSDE